MTNYLTKGVRVQWVVLPVLYIFFLGENSAHAWTSAHLFNVDVVVHVTPKALSTVTTDARFIVEAGRFHGFDLVDMPGGVLEEESCFAYRDDGRRYRLSFKRLQDGKTRVVLADDEEIGRGGITFQLVHKLDLIAAGTLRYTEGRARLDWTPLIWNEGLDNMTVYIELPRSDSGRIEVNKDISSDYVVEVGRSHVHFIKFRPVRWYPMRLVMDFNPRLVPGLSPSPEEEMSDKGIPVSAGAEIESPPFTTSLAFLFPVTAVFIGVVLLIAKFRYVCAIYHQVGLTATPSLLAHTTVSVRVALAVSAAVVGLWAQYKGYFAAGIPALIASAALFIVRRTESLRKPPPGGTWRKMSEDDIAKYRRLTSIYMKSRVSFFDITSFRGAAAFALLIGGLAAGAAAVGAMDSGLARAAVIDSLIPAVPVWFSHIRKEMPVDATLEGFHVLGKWQKSLAALLGAKAPGAEAVELWTREDESGPVEVRLRAKVPIDGVSQIEVAGETIRAGSIFGTGTVFLFRLKPGTAPARTLASCPNAAEHHLTPDLDEEIIVLRNRRGRGTASLSPLRTALSMIANET